MLKVVALGVAFWKLAVPLGRLAGRHAEVLWSKTLTLLETHQVLPRMKRLMMEKGGRRYAAIGAVVLLALVGLKSFFASPGAMGAEAEREQVRSEFEMPAIVPVKPDLKADQQKVAFKKARAHYHESLSRLRDQLAADMVKRYEDLRQRMDTPDGANRSFEDFKAEFAEFNKTVRGRSHRGWMPRSALVKDLREAYWAAVDQAADAFGTEANKLLAQYEKQGVTDAAKINPLKAAVMSAVHKDLLGIWRSDFSRLGKFSVWLVSIDETTATWRVDGTLDADRSSSAGMLQSGQGITFNDQKLSFQMCKVSDKTRLVLPGGISAALSVSSGMLLHEAWEDGKKIIMEPLHRSGDEDAQESVERWATVQGRPVKVAQEPDLKDPVSVWRALAELASFPARPEGQSVTGQEELFMPVRSSVFRPSTGFMPILTGVADTGYYNRRTMEELSKYKLLLNAEAPYLKRAAAELMSASIARMELGQANENYGNTATSFLARGQEDILLPAMVTTISYEMDRENVRDMLEQENPGKSVEVGLVIPSEDTLGHLQKTLEGVFSMNWKQELTAHMSALLAYDDMRQCDHGAELWETWLMPLVRQTYAKAPEVKLVSVDTQWLAPASQHEGGGFRAVQMLMKNLADHDLTNLILAVRAENEWGEGAMHYYYIKELDVSQALQLDFAHRLHKRSLRCSNKITLKASAWCDQGHMPEMSAVCMNPQPHKDLDVLHRSYVEYDQKMQEIGLLAGATMRGMNFLKLDPLIQVPRLREMISPQARYGMQPGKGAGLHRVHFVTLDEGPNMVGVEILGPDSTPLMKDKPLIKGEIKASPEQGAIVDCGGNLRVVLKGSEPLRIIQYNDDGTERWNASLVRIYSK